MSNVLYRHAFIQDVAFLAKIRGDYSGNEMAWKSRISGYMEGTYHPQKALSQRMIYVASANGNIVGFVAGHLTCRFNCEGELQWIDVVAEHRRQGVATELVKLLAGWLVEQKSYKICVDPGNQSDRDFYQKIGAEILNDHWM